VLKLEAFFPPLRILVEHCLQTAMLLSSSATKENDHTVEDKFIISLAETGPGFGPANKAR